MVPVNSTLFSVILSLLVVLSHGLGSISQTVTLFDVENNGADTEGFIDTHGLSHITAVKTVDGSTVYAFPFATTSTFTDFFPDSTTSTAFIQYFQTIVADSAGFQYYLTRSGAGAVPVDDLHCSFGDLDAICVISQIDEQASYTSVVTYAGGLIPIATLVNGVYVASVATEIPITSAPSTASAQPTSTLQSSTISIIGFPSAAGVPARKHTSAIVGAVVGAVGGISLVVCLYLVLWRKRRARTTSSSVLPVTDVGNGVFTVRVTPRALPTTTRSKPGAIQSRGSPLAGGTTNMTRSSERHDSSAISVIAAMQERLRAVEALLANQNAQPAPPPRNDDEESIPPPPY